jgi:hypothetical protein
MFSLVPDRTARSWWRRKSHHGPDERQANRLRCLRGTSGLERLRMSWNALAAGERLQCWNGYAHLAPDHLAESAARWGGVVAGYDLATGGKN